MAETLRQYMSSWAASIKHAFTSSSRDSVPSSSSVAHTRSNADAKFNHNNPRTWTPDGLRRFLSSNNVAGTEALFNEVYGWNWYEFGMAAEFVKGELEKHDWGAKFPSPGTPRYAERQEIERRCVELRPELFCRRQDAPASERPSWFFPELYINGRSHKESRKAYPHGFTIGFLFIKYIRGKFRKTEGKQAKASGMSSSATMSTSSKKGKAIDEEDDYDLFNDYGGDDLSEYSAKSEKMEKTEELETMVKTEPAESSRQGSPVVMTELDPKTKAELLKVQGAFANARV